MKAHSITHLTSETACRVWHYLNNSTSAKNPTREDEFFRTPSGTSDKPSSVGHLSEASDSFASTEKKVDEPSITTLLNLVEAGDVEGLRQYLPNMGSTKQVGSDKTQTESADLSPFELVFSKAVDAKSRTPLHIASEKGHTKMVTFLVGVCPNLIHEKLRETLETPLHIAAKHGHANVVEAIVESALDTDDRAGNPRGTNLAGTSTNFDAEGLTPIHRAAVEGHVKVVSALIKSGVSPQLEDQSARKRTTLLCAIDSRQYDVIEELVKRAGVDVDAPAGSPSLPPLHFEIRKSPVFDNESLKMVRFLVDAMGASTEENHEQISALHLAALTDRSDVLNFLIRDKKMNPNMPSGHATHFTPLHCAAQAGSVAAIRDLILNLGADPSAVNSDGLAPLHLAALLGVQSSISAMVVECGVNVNLRQSDEKLIFVHSVLGPLKNLTPLHCAIASGRAHVVQLLATELQAKVTSVTSSAERIPDEPLDETQQKSSSFSPLHMATALGFIHSIGVLIENGADLMEHAEHSHDTLLHTAVRFGQLETVHALLTDAGLDEIADNRNASGDTPFTIAIENGNIAIAALLVNYGRVPVDSLNKNGETCLTVLARQNLPRRIIFMVEKLRANVQQRNADGTHALQIAARLGHFEVVRCLLELGCDSKIID